MASFNQVILMGNLTRDVEVTFTKNGKAVGKFGMAMNRKWKDAQGQLREAVTFVDVSVWGKGAETLKKYCSKGSPLHVVGHLNLESWIDQQTQQKRSKLAVVADQFHFIGAPKKDGAAQPAAAAAPATNEPDGFGDEPGAVEFDENGNPIG